MGFSGGHFTTGQNNTALWQSSLPYAVGDIVAYNQVNYQCVTAHTGSSDFQDDLDLGRWVSFNKESINYIANNDAEAGITGWSIYKDAAASSPADGTGTTGPTTITFAASSSSPLRGSRSYILTTTAANLQGEGVSYDFAIANADKAKVLNISFEYSSDVVFTTGDFAVFIYDVTNGQLIQPAGYQIQGVSVGTINKHIATFQTSSNSTSYRLIIHRAVSTSQAVNLKIDQVKVSPEVRVYGAPATDWVAYTPTLSNAGTTSTNTGFWRRVGDSMQIKTLQIFTGSGSASNLIISIPTGYTIDTTKLSIDYDLGFGSWYDASATQEKVAHITRSGTTGLIVTIDTNGPSPIKGSDIQSGDYIRTSVTVPISGWSSSVEMSSSTDTRVVAAKYKGTPTGTITTSLGASGTTVFPTRSFDTHGAYNAGSYTCPVPGIYKVTFQTSVTGTESSNAYAALGFYRDGSLQEYHVYRFEGSALDDSSLNATNTFECVAGTVLTVRVSSTIGSPAYTVDANAHWIMFERLSGPSTIAASETVAAKYFLSAGMSVTGLGGAQLINFDTKVEDTHGAVTTGGSWKFTAPISGLYLVSAKIYTGAPTWSLGGETGLDVYKQGSIEQTIKVNRAQGAGAYRVDLSGSPALVRLNAGQYIDLRIYSDLSYTTSFGAANCFVQIIRVGN